MLQITVTFDLLTLKLIGIICQPWHQTKTPNMVSLSLIGLKLLKVDKNLMFQITVTLTFDLLWLQNK